MGGNPGGNPNAAIVTCGDIVWYVPGTGGLTGGIRGGLVDTLLGKLTLPGMGLPSVSDATLCKYHNVGSYLDILPQTVV